jgi:hypothetical protein
MKANFFNWDFGMRAAVALLILLTEIVFVDFLGSAGLEFVLSSALVTVSLLIQLQFGIRREAGTPADIVVFIFNWLFLDLAPKVQLISMPQQLVNTSSVTVELVASTNLACALFIITFTLAYTIITKRVERPAAVPVQSQGADSPLQFSVTGIGLAVMVCMAVVAVAAPIAYASLDTPNTSPAVLVMNRFLLFLPSATLLILLNETVSTPRKLAFSRVCVLLLLLVLVAITENPYTEKRNAIGPLYLCLAFVGFRKGLASQGRRMLLLVASMVIGFPAISIITHNRHMSITDLSIGTIGERIEEHYFSINYDSWANIYSAVEIVKTHGLQWGHQLLGSLLFFVPSSIWTTKPLATGIFIADYLIANYSMWFTNLSAPLIAEGYLDFGYLGVVAYAGVIAAVAALLNALAIQNTRWMSLPLALYGSVFLMFLLRGSLMVAMGFASAAFLSFWFAWGLLSQGKPIRHGGVAAARPRSQPAARVSSAQP